MGIALSSIPHRIQVSDDRKYLSIGQLCERYSVSRMWVERRLRDPNLPLPQPHRFGGPKSARRWTVADIEAWERARAKINEGR